MDNVTITISKSELESIIKDSFNSGAHSYANWCGQPDTTWSNVEEDKNEYVSGKIKEAEAAQTTT